MHPSLNDLVTVHENSKIIVANCVSKARACKNALLFLGWPKEKLTMVNCLTKKKEHHRVLVVNHEGFQWVVDSLLHVVTLLDDVPYTNWYGGKELT